MDPKSSPVLTTTTSAYNSTFEDDMKDRNLFAIYFSGIVILAYALSIFVSILHMRTESVVYALTRPEPDEYFSEYIILIRTSQMLDSSLDDRGRIYIQLNGSFSDSVRLHLKKGKGMKYFLERGTTNIFVYHSPSVLGDIEKVEISLVNDLPNEIPYVEWRPEYISVLHPTTKMRWGSIIYGKLRCSDILTEIITFTAKANDRHSILKAFYSFHVGLSLFFCPLRFGMYNNLVNVVVIFLIICGLMFTSLLTEFALKDPKNKKTVEYYGVTLCYAFSLVVIWLVEIFVEAIFRNTVPRVSTSSYAMFQGLIKPVPHQFGIREFVINYNWQTVSLLVPQTSVIIPYGLTHPSSRVIFSVEPVRSYFNMGGHLSLEVERCGNWYLRSMNICALPLPQSIRWLAKEARTQKEDILVQQYISNFTAPMCHCCCWLADWPLQFIEEPYQVGLIISHVICLDILSLSRLQNMEYCARLAQICAHQWHGMISTVLLQIVRQSMEYRGESLSGVKNFIHRTVVKFGKRNAREIQGAWKMRQIRLKEMSLKRFKDIPLDLEEDENESANIVHSKTFGNNDWTLWNMICRKYEEVKDWSDTHGIRHNSPNIDFNDFTEDFLVFDVKSPTGKDSHCLQTLTEVGTEMYGGSASNIGRKYPKVMPKFSIVKEDKVKCRSKRKLLKKSKSNRRRPQVTVNPIFQSEAEYDSIKLDNAGGDTNVDKYYKMNAAEMCCTATEKCDFPGVNPNDSDMNMNASVSLQGSSELLSEDPYVPKSFEKHQQQTALLQMIVEQKQMHKRGIIKERVSQPISTYEEVTLGPPFDVSYAMEKDPDNLFCALRHADEMLAHCCENGRCIANSEIHRMVGVSSLDILKRVIRDLLHFALDSNHIEESDKLWKRKKMVKNLFHWMNSKALAYESKTFKTSKDSLYEGKTCNQAFTAILASLEVLVDVTRNIKQVADLQLAKEKQRLYAVNKKAETRCLYCAKILATGLESNNKGCYEVEKLVKFFTESTIVVAEKEINIEFAYKYTVQRFCAMIVSNAMKELAIELEDPPMVMACKVTRAMICKLLLRKLPKTINFTAMTADDLRRLGTRRERMQARNALSRENKRQSEAEKRHKQILIHLQELLINKWRIGVKENDLEYCAMLLAQILVHEKIMGFAVYTGFLLKEHEELLNGSVLRLVEIEKRAYTAVLKIARHMLQPILISAVETSDTVDVLFTNVEMETLYVLEAVCIAQMKSEPTFLKTCCYYVEDIISQKVEEFKSFFVYLKNLGPSDDLKIRLQTKLFKCTFKASDEIQLLAVQYHSSIASPMLRWGQSAISGFPFPNELRRKIVADVDFEELLPSVLKARTTEKRKQIVTKLLETRLKVIALLDLQKLKKNKELRVHLAQVQANLTEQVALVSQSITNTFSVDTDYQRQFSNDDLFNVEFYATGNMKLLIPTSMGFIFLIALIIFTLAITLYTTLTAGNMTTQEVQTWFIRFLYCFLTYGMLFEPLKCFLYYIIQSYTR